LNTYVADVSKLQEPRDNIQKSITNAQIIDLALVQNQIIPNSKIKIREIVV
jgi:hypothetical protein